MTAMRSIVRSIVVVSFFAAAATAYSQNTLRPATQPQTAQPQAGQPNSFRPTNSGQGAPGGFQQGGAAVPADAAFMSQVSYALGRNFAMNLRDNEIDADINSLVAGINDALSGAQAKWTDQQLDAALQQFSQQMQQKAAARMQREAAKNQQEASAFLTQNGQREGVQTTNSGLQFRVLKQGNGPSPTINDTVRCNYKGTLLNGTEFDNSTRGGKPAQFPVKRVIPGWQEALQKMHVGDKWQLFVPPKLAYDTNPPGPPIEAGSLLVFEIELVDIVK
jgi:FKBP-type peptidyl-prolyl cis-trans isomerase FklB